VPVAVKATVSPFATEAGSGVTVIASRRGAVTVSAALPETRPEVAVMVAGPTAAPCAVPGAVMVALALLEPQVADAVRSWVEVSE
jgi:hypothetical protein